MRAVAQLRALRQILTPDRAWLPGSSFGAEDASGHACQARSPDAVRFGVLAGLTRLDSDTDERLRAVDLIKRAVGAKWMHAWEQDASRTQAEVLDAVDRAIALETDGGFR